MSCEINIIKLMRDKQQKGIANENENGRDTPCKVLAVDAHAHIAQYENLPHRNNKCVKILTIAPSMELFFCACVSVQCACQRPLNRISIKQDVQTAHTFSPTPSRR